MNRSGLKIILMYHSVACYFLKLGNEGEIIYKCWRENVGERFFFKHTHLKLKNI